MNIGQNDFHDVALSVANELFSSQSGVQKPNFGFRKLNLVYLVNLTAQTKTGQYLVSPSKKLKFSGFNTPV